MSPHYVTPEERERDDAARDDAAEQRAGNEMIAADERAEQFHVASGMLAFAGGAFYHMGQFLLRADPERAAIIKRSFPVEWAKYKEMKGESK